MNTIEKGVYRHRKTGNLYDVVGVALHTETEEELVVYRPHKKKDYELFVRPIDMFVELVDIGGVVAPRFVRLDEALDE